tara:strand:- start:197 stop:697 length:501 start_codon:yes stop_codon:yes gene_type:complete
MKQVLIDGKIVTEINENVESTVTLGVQFPDETVISVGQILEDDLTIREITEQEIIERFGLSGLYGKMQLFSKLTKAEITSFIAASKTDSSVEVIKEILDVGGTIDLIEDNTLLDQNIITSERREDLLGITEKKEFIAKGMKLNFDDPTTTTTTTAVPTTTTTTTTA